MENVEPFEYLYEMLQMMTAKYGTLGIAAAMFAESAGVPFASAFVLLTAGSMILRGGASFWSILLASTIGITLGSILSYILGLLGSMVGSAVRTNYFNNYNNISVGDTVPPRSKLLLFQRKYGNYSIFMAQLWGLSRTFISFPAGAMHMNFYLFTLYTFLGGSIYSLIAITLSIALTGTMGLTIKILRILTELSPWLLTIPAFLILALIYFYYYGRRRQVFLDFKSIWKQFKDRFIS